MTIMLKKYLNFQPFLNEDDGLEISGNTSEVAEPDTSDTNSDIDNEIEEVDKVQETAEPVQKKEQNKEDNAKFAAARREAEKKAFEAEQRAKQLEKDYSIAKKYAAEYGIYSEDDIKKNWGANGINSLEDFEREVQRQQLVEKGIDPDEFNNMLNNHPVIQQANTYLQQVQQQHSIQLINQKISDIHKEYPGHFDHIKTVDDLVSDPKYTDIYNLVSKGYELDDAIYKAYKTEIANKSVKQAVKSTIANIHDNAKRGIVSSGDSGTDDTIEVLSSEGKAMATAFGVNPKAVAKYVKEKLKK